MELESFEKFWKEWRYGLIEGLLFGIILMGTIFVFFGNVALDLVILVLLLPIFYVNMTSLLGSKKKQKEVYEGCPKCGSTKRHKKSCSKAKKS